MAVGKTNPMRQQMINMMYLVLTALLALNVSAEILLAFQTVNEGMEKSIKLIDSKNEFTMKQFDKLMSTSASTTQEYFDLATKTNKIADDSYDYLQNLIDKIIYGSGGREANTHGGHEEGGIVDSVMVGMSNIEIAERFFVNGPKGEELFNLIGETRKDFFDVIDNIETIDKDVFASNITIKAESKTKGEWAIQNFHMVPAIAAVTLLTKIQQDVRTSQANIIDALINAIGAEDVSFDQLIPVVLTEKSAVAVGEKYTADVLLAAYDSKKDPEIFIGGNKMEVKNGKAHFEVTPNSQGPRENEVKIVVTNKKTGEKKEYISSMKYDVFNAPAIISATKMNVVYIGLDNPISVSVPGFQPSQVSGRASYGSLRKTSAGKYILNVPDSRGRVHEVNISANVSLPGGGGRNMGKKNFRIKNVPKPTPYFGSKESGEISPGEIRMVNFITVRLEDFAFEGLKYRVSKFRFVYQPRRGNAKLLNGNGARLSSAMKQALGSPQKGDRIIIDNIWATAPKVGRKRLPTGIILTVK
ncbi:MAG: gliding motility protein GldM [Bacteroidota bacterium]|nr:gliding motility protein GldM [Bacteroidota bacterium]